jgi:hypothetical protein
MVLLPSGFRVRVLCTFPFFLILCSGIFVLTTASIEAPGPTHLPVQWVLCVLSGAVNRPAREADNSSPSSAEVKNAWSCTSTHQYVLMPWYLIKHRDNFTFTLPMCVTCPTHLILLDLMSLILFGEAHNLWNSSLCSHLQHCKKSKIMRNA